MDIKMLGEKVKDLGKKYRYALLILLLGAVLMLFPTKSGKQQPIATQPPGDMQTQPDIGQQLESILGQIQGAGKVRVMLTIAAGEKTIYQTDTDVNRGDSGTFRVETVIVTDANRAQSGLVQQVIPQSYLGAIIVCQGAQEPAVRLAIVDAVSRATGLGADRISVLKMK